MPEWMMSTESLEAALTPEGLLTRLLAALVLGGCVAAVYRASHGRETQRPAALMTTLVLLSVLIAMVSIVIGNSVARAFSLVGALSIVRFRTVVDDTRDTAFVIFAVIVGMASGAGLFLVPLIGIPIVGLASVGLSRWTMATPMQSSLPCRLTLRLSLGRDPAVLAETLSRHLASFEMIETATARQGEAIDFTYRANLRSQEAITALVTELNRTAGVMSVELRRV